MLGFCRDSFQVSHNLKPAGLRAGRLRLLRRESLTSIAKEPARVPILQTLINIIAAHARL